VVNRRRHSPILLRKADGWSAAAFVGIAVFSHWVLDWLVHRPDVPLYDNSFKVGLGLWNYPTLAFVLEIAVLFSGMYLYTKTPYTVPKGRGPLKLQSVTVGLPGGGPHIPYLARSHRQESPAAEQTLSTPTSRRS
jgi:hypothetical protein